MTMTKFEEDTRELLHALYETVLDEARSLVSFVRDAWPMLLTLFLILSVGIWFIRPAPPRHVLLEIGSQGGAYETMGKQYVAFFAKNGITLELVHTAGAGENIARLRDQNDPLQAAFVQGGLMRHADAQELASLGSIDYEPLWFFYRADRFKDGESEDMHYLSQPVAIGEPGSGTYAQAMHIMKLLGIADSPNLRKMSNKEGAEAFRRGDVSALLLVEGIDSENLQSVLKDPVTRIRNFRRAAAYTKLMPFYHEVHIPEGALSLQRNFPEHNTTLVATTTSLVIDKNMHPAIQMLFLEAARSINGQRSFFSRNGEFPAYKESILPESAVAKRFYARGTPFLMDYLPFWLAEFIDRVFLLCVPMFAFAYPVIKSMPTFRLGRVRKRINEIYGALKFLEQDLITHYEPEQQADYVKRLNEIEQKSLALKIPNSMISDYYSLRSTIDFMRSWMQRTDENTGAHSVAAVSAETAVAVTAGELAAADPNIAAADAGKDAVLGPTLAQTPNAGQTS